MRSDRDKRTDSEREIDEFLSQFETPVDELSADINSYLSEKDTTKMTVEKTFYKQKHAQTEPLFSAVDVFGSADENAGKEAPAEIPAETSAKTVSEESPAVSEDVTSPEPEPIAEPDSAVDQAKPEPVPEVAAAETKNKVSDEKPAAKPATKKSTGKKKSGKKKSGKKKSGKKKSSKKKSARRKNKGILYSLFMKPNKSFDESAPVSRTNKPAKISFLKIFRDLVCIGMIGALCGLIYATSCIMSAPKINPKDIYSVIDTSSVIYDDQGKQIDNVFYTEDRKVVYYQDMPEDLINSFIAIEDKTFWKHHGFNWTRMFGAILSSITGHGRISGTSTITQQLSRNVYLADIKSVRSIKRKILEMYYAARIESDLSKEEIIEAYLNTIYLGHGCYGVGAAAKTYFSKNVSDLSLVQCAALAALPQSPDSYALLKFASDMAEVSEDSKIIAKEPNTIVTNDIAKDRRDLTLWLMRDQGYITQEQYDENAGKPLNDFIKPTLASSSNNYMYFHEYLVSTIIEDLMDQYGMEYADAERMVYTKGLQIYSTLDSQAQNIVVKEFKDSGNFPSVSAIYNTDADGNMLNNDKEIALYNYNHFFNENGDYTLTSDDVTINSDGSVTIKKNRYLNIYETQVNGAVDYSLEFKNYYRVIDDKLYSIQGGYINVPSTYKSLDADGNLVISSAYFTDHEGAMRKEDGKLIITDDAYSLASRTLQPQGAMVIVGVGTGEVKAMVGGRTFKGQKLLNRALNARQPGSSIKPLAVYGAALQKSYELAAKNQKWKFIDFDIDKQGTKGWGDYVTVHSSIEDEKTHIENRDWPENVTRSFSGKNTFKTAIQKSINTCAVKLQLQVGNEFSMNQLHKFGITTAIDDESQYANDMNPAALALGAMCQGVEPLEMALAYASFPGKGMLNTPVCYTKVLDRNGDVLLEGKSEQSEAINEGVAFIMTDVLQSVVKANGYGIDGVKTGGKTGTTNDRYDIWFDGFTPSYAASLWIGTDQNVEMSDLSYVAARLWGKIINQIPRALEGQYPAQPSNVISKGGEYFTTGTETGLTSWSKEDEEKKRRAEAKKKWEAERANHRIWIEEKGHFEQKTETVTIVDVPAYDEEITEMVEVGKDEEGNPIFEPQQRTVHHDAQTHTETHNVGDPFWVVDEKGHWEYEKGWRDGDFKYKKGD